MAKGKSTKSKKRSNATTQTAQVPVKAAKATDTAKAKEKTAVAATKTDKNKAAAKASKTDKGKTPAKKDSTKKPNIFKRLMQYLQDVRSELKRVTWPTKDEVLNSSLVVIGALVFFGILIFAVDSVVVPLLNAYSGLVG